MGINSKREISLSLTIKGVSAQKLHVIKAAADEALSRPFRIAIDVLSEEEFELLPNMGNAVSLECTSEGEPVRHFSGVLIAGQFLEEIEETGFAYRLIAAPASHFHDQGKNFRIFQEMQVRDIVKDVLEACKIEHSFAASGGTRTLAYCVQYDESDFAFVCRLLEEAGLYYYYDHGPSSHKMIICDGPSNHKELDQPDIIYNPGSSAVGMRNSQSGEVSSIGIYANSFTERVVSGAESKVTLRDFDFKDPAKPQESKTTEKQAHRDDQIEVYQWPGRFYKEADGDDLGSVVLEARRAQRLCYDGTSHYPGFIPGYCMNLKSHAIKRLDAKYLITRCVTELASEQYRSGIADEGIDVEFTTIPADTQFRAPLSSPRPVVKGLETAIVTGPAGEEIYVDEYGRIKVQFHWDREGELDDKSSCWIRVSQTGGLGNIIIPRVGHEVLVDFVNGNPDRPIVVGRVFNQEHMPVYDLPGEKTKALWRTKTYKQDSGSSLPDAEALDSGKPGANEIRLDDATGKEEFYLHAERDMNTRIRHDETHHVGKDVEIKVGKNRTETVGVDEKITIKRDRTEDVKGKETVTVVGDRKHTIKSNDTLDVTKTIKIDAGKEIQITAAQKITITVGSSSITIKPTSIEIKTVQLKMSASAQAELKSAMTDVKASGILTAKGGMVLIN